MEMIKRPLSRTVEENRANLEAELQAEERAFGYPVANRQQRRSQAMMERKLRRREPRVVVSKGAM